MRWALSMVPAALATAVMLGSFTPARAADLTVFAAASTIEAVDDAVQAFERETGAKVATSYASSGTLAQQIERGAPAHLFISADTKWMSYLDQRKLLAPGTRGKIFENRLVLIVPYDSSRSIAVEPDMPLSDLLGDGRLAIGDPDYVPAGEYAKAALQTLNVWPTVERKLAPAQDVRAVLALVERGEAPAGIVYATDARASKKVRIVGVFLQSSHPPIDYEMAVVAAHATEDAKKLRAFLASGKAREIYAGHGFAVE